MMKYRLILLIIIIGCSANSHEDKESILTSDLQTFYGAKRAPFLEDTFTDGIIQYEEFGKDAEWVEHDGIIEQKKVSAHGVNEHKRLLYTKVPIGDFIAHIDFMIKSELSNDMDVYIWWHKTQDEFDGIMFGGIGGRGRGLVRGYGTDSFIDEGPDNEWDTSTCMEDWCTWIVNKDEDYYQLAIEYPNGTRVNLRSGELDPIWNKDEYYIGFGTYHRSEIMFDNFRVGNITDSMPFSVGMWVNPLYVNTLDCKGVEDVGVSIAMINVGGLNPDGSLNGALNSMSLVDEYKDKCGVSYALAWVNAKFEKTDIRNKGILTNAFDDIELLYEYFDGIHMDIEFRDTDDDAEEYLESYKELLQKLHRENKLLSVAGSMHGDKLGWKWTSDYYGDLNNVVDRVELMAYDTRITDEDEYIELVAGAIIKIREAFWGELQVGLPAHKGSDDPKIAHKPSENIRTTSRAIKIAMEEVSIEGVVIYDALEFDDDDLEVFREYWGDPR